MWGQFSDNSVSKQAPRPPPETRANGLGESISGSVSDTASEPLPVHRVRSKINLQRLQEQHAESSTRLNDDSDKDIYDEPSIPKSKSIDIRIASGVSVSKDVRTVVVRYFLDRPGYGIHNSSARLWFNPPEICTPRDIREFLTMQNIALKGLLIEVFLDKFGSFMMLEATEAGCIEWDFSDTTPIEPAMMCVRLTDLEQAYGEEMTLGAPHAPGPKSVASPAFQMANSIPVGLFSFSIMTALETSYVTAKLFPGSVEESLLITWGPYMFMVGGVLQIIVGLTQIFRNNLYGTVAFLGFGCIWAANGLVEILKVHFSADDTQAGDLTTVSDPWGRFIRLMFIFLFSCVLEVQTWTMNKLSSTMIGLLCLKILIQSLTPWSEVAEYAQFVVGWSLSIFVFYIFFIEMTNQVYHKTIFKTYKWSEEHSPEELFGAAGRTGTLYSKAVNLRQANYERVQRGGLRAAPTTSTALEQTSLDEVKKSV